MNEELEKIAHHAVYHVGKEVVKNSGCVVTLIAMTTGIGTIFCVMGFIFLA